MESKILSCGETAIIKSALHKKTTSININQIKINRIVLFEKTSHGNKGSFKVQFSFGTFLVFPSP